jgi:hypothetical protein
MSSKNEHLDAIKDMRNMMERSSKFLSFSGLAGVIIGITALAGVAVFCVKFNCSPFEKEYYHAIINVEGAISEHALGFLIKDALIVFFISAGVETWLAIRKSKQLQVQIWDTISQRMLINILIPFMTGVLFCMILLMKNQITLLAPVSLIFYGLALVNVSKYTVDEIRSLGIMEIILGLVAAMWSDLGLLNWAIGFGLLHILYGLFIYSKEKK